MTNFKLMAAHARRYKGFHEGGNGLVGDDSAAVMFNMIAVIAEHLGGEREIAVEKDSVARAIAQRLPVNIDWQHIRGASQAFVDSLSAQGIEARQGGNGEAGAVHESPTPPGDAPDTAALKATPPRGDAT